MSWELMTFIIWYLLISVAFYLYGIDEGGKYWDFPMFVCCLFWFLTFPCAVLIAIGLYLWNRIEEWWRNK